MSDPEETGAQRALREAREAIRSATSRKSIPPGFKYEGPRAFDERPSQVRISRAPTYQEMLDHLRSELRVPESHDFWQAVASVRERLRRGGQL